jgi:hypothetical protein
MGSIGRYSRTNIWFRMENLTARIPAFRPKLPCVEKLIPYLREINKSRWYSNRGMLVEGLERRIATAAWYGLRCCCDGVRVGGV